MKAGVFGKKVKRSWYLLAWIFLQQHVSKGYEDLRHVELGFRLHEDLCELTLTKRVEVMES